MTATARNLLLVSAMIVLLVIGAAYGRARAQVLTPGPEEVRFQLLANEPIATADRRAVVPGTSALVLKDRRSGACYFAITLGNAMAMSPVNCGS